jgi:hypothetical protein
MFTGQTDLDHPDARDGTRSEPKPRPIKRHVKLDWHGFARHWTVDKAGAEVFNIDKTPDGLYLASVRQAAPLQRLTLGTFQTIAEAGAACERHANK